VPGTHDPALGLALIEALGRGGTVALPRFDKARDEPGPPEVHDGPADIILFEGWCVGARPQEEADLAEPVNTLEREADPDGVWRRHVNAQLDGPYRALFARIDLLVLLAAPGFEVVGRWRIEQEHALRREKLARGEPVEGVMSDDAVRGFVEHYRRLTVDLLRRGGAWADLVIPLDANRRPIGGG
ncbi:MAG: kinase, partial [Pseudomonadota bacterium]